MQQSTLMPISHSEVLVVSTVSSTNTIVANLLQTLSNAGSPVASSPALVSALDKSSPADIVKLSTDAAQLESVDAIFGISGGSSTATSTPLSNLESLLATSGSTSAQSQAAQLDTYQSASQLSNIDGLFGISNPSANLLPNLEDTVNGLGNTSTGSSTGQIVNYQSLQSADTSALFGNSNNASPSNSPLSVVG
jgi:hypothetical protein